MALITPDFSEVQDPITPGVYRVRIVKAEQDAWENERGTTKFIKWELETFGSEDTKNNGRKIWHRTPIQGKGAFRLADFYRAAMKETLGKGGFDTEMMLGKELEVTITEQKDKEGNLNGYTEVKTVRPIQ